MLEGNGVVVKFNYSTDIRKFEVNSADFTYADLVNKFTSKYNIAQCVQPVFKYIDSDGDTVSVNSDEDIRLALREEKLTIVVTMTDSITESTESVVTPHKVSHTQQKISDNNTASVTNSLAAPSLQPQQYPYYESTESVLTRDKVLQTHSMVGIDNIAHRANVLQPPQQLHQQFPFSYQMGPPQYACNPFSRMRQPN